MPQLTFIFPYYLALLAALPMVWASAALLPSRLPRWRRAASLGLRSAILLALVLALSGAQLALPAGTTTTVFLLDASDSLSLAQRAQAETFVQQAIDSMPPDDRAGVVVFGERALVERRPSDERVFGQVTAQPRGGATAIDQAIQLGLALLPAEDRRRLVLLSDGGETQGSALKAARQAAAQGVPIDVVSLNGGSDGPDAQISALELPASARAGQELQLAISASSNVATSARLRVEAAGALLVDQQVALAGGAQRFEIRLPAPPPGFNRYVVRLEAPGDARAQNNVAEAYTFALGPPQVLLIEGASGEAQQLAAALRAARMQASVVSPRDAPLQLAELAPYDALVLVDVPRASLPESLQSAISAYVHDLGRGFMMIGGPQSFGAGGWRDTPVEQALPVTMDIPNSLRIPPVAIVVVIDTSGSMGAEEGGRTKLSLAVEGAQRIASLLRDEDELTVVPFDEAPRDVVGPLPGARRDEAIRALEGVQVGGGGITIHDALADAAARIRASTLPVRHIITITDGSDTTQQEGALEIVQSLRAESVTLSSIAIGDGQDVSFLQRAAAAGGGRTFLTESAANLPAILVDEAQATLRPYLVEREFAPARGAPHPALDDAAGLPALYGLVLTTPRETSQVLLGTPDGQALLVAWQYGLGRSLAWTSDMTGRWGRDWIGWTEFPRMAAQMVAWLLPIGDAGRLTLATSHTAGVLTLEASASDTRGAPQSGLRVSARMIGTDGEGAAIGLREVAPGRYQATIADRPPGAYLLQVVAADASGQAVGMATAGAVVPQSAEYAGSTAQPGLLQAIAAATAGRTDPAPGDVFRAGGWNASGAPREIGQLLVWLALALLPLDIAARRLFLRREMLRAAPTTAPQPTEAALSVTPRPPPEPPAPAGQAGARSRREQELEQLREAQERARRRARGEE
jgi:uncharacterized membrane protein